MPGLLTDLDFEVPGSVVPVVQVLLEGDPQFLPGRDFRDHRAPRPAPTGSSQKEAVGGPCLVDAVYGPSLWGTKETEVTIGDC